MTKGKDTPSGEKRGAHCGSDMVLVLPDMEMWQQEVAVGVHCEQERKRRAAASPNGIYLLFSSAVAALVESKLFGVHQTLCEL